MADIIDGFELPKAEPSIIMVAGIGGGGSNAVNHMFHQGITDVSFMICNTDIQALKRSQVPIKIVLGQSLTQGLGAGNDPEIGKAAAEESYDEIVDVFRRHGTKMVFVTAGMGGGTGTGAAPVIARAAKELGILTVAIVTLPFVDEGPKRFKQAYKGLEEIRKYVDSLLVINNENILEIHGDLTLSEAFGMADNIVADAAKGIAEIITGDNYVNVDFKDVEAVMSNSGVALMGTGRGRGENRALDAVRIALTSPLLNHKDMSGAKNILVNITSSDEREAKLSEMKIITKYIQEQTGSTADLIWGFGQDPSLGEDIQVTIIATRFDMDKNLSYEDIAARKPQTEAKEEPPVPEPAAEPESEPADKEDNDPAAREDAPAVPPAPARPERIEPGMPPVRKAFVPPVHREMPPPVRAQQPPRTVKIDEPDTERINYDELENSPAWMRRNVSFEEGAAEKVSRVTLKEDPSTPREPENPAGGLF